MRRETVPEFEIPRVDMSSLIDVSFLLLIYFLVSSSLEPVEGDLVLTLPATANCGTPVEIAPVEVEVLADGRICLNGETIEAGGRAANHLPILTERLRFYCETARLLDCEPMVLIDVDDSAKGQSLIDVLDVLADRDVDIRFVTFLNI